MYIKKIIDSSLNSCRIESNDIDVNCLDIQNNKVIDSGCKIYY